MTADYLRKLEAAGVELVLTDIALGAHGSPGSTLRDEVFAWVRSKEFSRNQDSAFSAKEIALHAFNQARRANRIAIAQMIVSTITTISVVFIGWYLSK